VTTSQIGSPSLPVGDQDPANRVSHPAAPRPHPGRRHFTRFGCSGDDAIGRTRFAMTIPIAIFVLAVAAMLLLLPL
jgi:hypothetical protein